MVGRIIETPVNAPFSTVRVEYKAISKGSDVAAKLLSLFEHTHTALIERENAKERQSVLHNRSANFDVQFWTGQKLADKTGTSREFIYKKIDDLDSLGFIKIIKLAEGQRPVGFEVRYKLENVQDAVNKYFDIALDIAHNRQARQRKTQGDSILQSDFQEAVKAYKRMDWAVQPSEAQNAVIPVLSQNVDKVFFNAHDLAVNNLTVGSDIVHSQLDYIKDDFLFFEKKKEKKEISPKENEDIITNDFHESDKEKGIIDEKKKNTRAAAYVAQTNIVHIDGEERRVYGLDVKNGITETNIVANMVEDMIKYYRQNETKRGEVVEKLLKEGIYDAKTGNNEQLRENIKRLLTDYCNWYVGRQLAKHAGNRKTFKIIINLNALHFGLMRSLAWANRDKRVIKTKTEKKSGTFKTNPNLTQKTAVRKQEVKQNVPQAATQETGQGQIIERKTITSTEYYEQIGGRININTEINEDSARKLEDIKQYAKQLDRLKNIQAMARYKLENCTDADKIEQITADYEEASKAVDALARKYNL